MWLDYDDYTGEVWNKPVPTIKRFRFRHDDSGDPKCLTISTISSDETILIKSNFVFDSVKFDRTVQQGSTNSDGPEKYTCWLDFTECKKI